MEKEITITNKFLQKLHTDAIFQRLALLKKVKELNVEGLNETVFEVKEYDALTPQEIREIIQNKEGVSEMSERIMFHFNAVKQLEKTSVLEI